nr:retrovirus-related Pol polyprotein from transposon TNT 1-94 [Tanacetum cinerariifolium]
MLVTKGGGSGTPTEPDHTPSSEAQQTLPTATSLPSLPPVTTPSIPTVIPSDTPQLRQYTRRARIGQSSALPPVLKARVKLLEDRDGGGIAQSGEDATIKGRSLDEGEESAIERSTEKGSNNTEEMVNVLTSLDAATVLSSVVSISISPVTKVFVAEVPTGSVSIPTASPPGTGVPTGGVPTGSGSVPTASPIFTTATVATPYTRRKGKEKMVESETPKKRKLQEQMDVQMARQLEEEMQRDAQRMNEQIARDAEIARIHAKEELQIMIDGLDRNNETVAKEDLNKLWALVKETLNIRPTTSDKEKELWVELKRLYEPDVEDLLWTHTQNMMHAPVEWKLYDTCGVHHVISKDQEMFMLVEKDYPLRKGGASSIQNAKGLVLVDFPKGKRKWVFRNKKDERGIVTRNKTRLVAQVHTQEEGIDYEEVVRNKMHKAFPLSVKSSYCQKKFPLLVRKVSPVKDKRCHCQEDCTAIKDRDVMTSDAIKKKAGYTYYMAKKMESKKAKIVDKLEEQHVSPVKVEEEKDLCVMVKLKKDVVPRKTRPQTIFKETGVVAYTYAKWGHKLNDLVVDDLAVQSLLDLRNGSKATRLESLKQKRQAVAGEGSSAAHNKYYNSDTDSDATLYSSSSDKIEESENETNDAEESDMDLSDDN